MPVVAEDITAGSDPRITDFGASDEPVEVIHRYLRQDPHDPTHWSVVEGPDEPGTYLVISTPTDPEGPYGPGSSVFVVNPAPEDPSDEEEGKPGPQVTITGIDLVDGKPVPRIEVDGKPFDPASDPEGRYLETAYYVRTEDGSWKILEGAPTAPGSYRVVVRLMDRDGQLISENHYDFTLPLGGARVVPATGDPASAAGLLGGAAAVVSALAAWVSRRTRG